ncbi:hypothetical protein TRFO_02763 [Tritrichomonas foetus]|uniref:Phosphatidylinositol-specific phospholipase C X domain-containing protein n=1 Tax=Tritrichomonas foetus TaxID=1144522 RepID=A0A1J4KZ97_9EUKA|nr:hypothetical protein TRFO_02763 [Tritrichomonas foetus]|eukprot:OHT16482.1 hypothetical protein TRFO_02763 [Tritrichomonas foetus]
MLLCFLSFAFSIPESDWMGIFSGTTQPSGVYQRVNNFENRRLLDIIMPGSHDAAVNLDVNSFAARAQGMNILNQLNSGVRFLDLRVRPSARASQPIKLQTFHAPLEFLAKLHMFKGQTFSEILDQVNQFLDNHPTEIVIFKVKPLAEYVTNIAQRIMAQIDNNPSLKNKLIKKPSISEENLKSKTYQNLVVANKRLLIIFESETVTNNYVYSKNLLYSNPPLATSRDDLVNRLKSNLPVRTNHLLQNKFVLFHWTITYTPFKLFGIRSITESLEQNLNFFDTIRSEIFPMNKLFQIIMMDFVNPNKCKRVIILNQERYLNYFRVINPPPTHALAPPSAVPVPNSYKKLYRRHHHGHSSQHSHRRHHRN